MSQHLEIQDPQQMQHRMVMHRLLQAALLSMISSHIWEHDDVTQKGERDPTHLVAFRGKMLLICE